MYRTLDFDDPFKDELTHFVNHKRALGYDYGKSMTARLAEMNRFFREQGLTDVKIPKMVYMNWIQLKENETTSNQEKRYCAIHGFAQFLIVRGYSDVYDTENPVIQRNEFTPYIYTEDEITRIFNGADNYLSGHKPTFFDNSRMIPVLLRLLYSTGMRISESLAIRLCDVDIDKGAISLLDGKNHIGRVVIVSASMRRILEKYICATDFFGEDEYLFHGYDGRPYTVSTVRHIFHRILDKVGIQRRFSGKYPRLHDFRHLFAIRALEQMVEKGYDLYTSLPLLCKYLGHKSIIETEYYIRLTKNQYSQITNATSKYAPHLFPDMEVGSHE
jgi:Site-specific recombinase XerD